MDAARRWFLAVGMMLLPACDDAPSAPITVLDDPRLTTYPVLTGTFHSIGGQFFFETGGEYYPVEGTSAQVYEGKPEGSVWEDGGEVKATMKSNSLLVDMLYDYTLKQNFEIVGTDAGPINPVFQGMKFDGLKPTHWEHDGSQDFVHSFGCGVTINGKVTFLASHSLFAIVKSASITVGKVGEATIEPRSRNDDRLPVFFAPYTFPCEDEGEEVCEGGDDGPTEGGESQLSPLGRARLDCSGDPGGGGENEFGCYYCEWEGDIIYYPYTDTWEIEITYENCYQVDDSYCIDNS